jgi:predicted site-specific integrase-resolvase
MSSSEHFDFRLTTACVVERLRDRYGVSRSGDTVRMWGRLGKLPVLELDNGQRLFRACDVDELGARIVANEAQRVA